MSTHRKLDDKQHPIDRVTTQDDEKKRILDLTALQLIPPENGIFDEPTRCYKLNKVWAKTIMGMVSHLTDIAAWKEANHEAYIGCTEVAKFIAQNDDCDDLCTIEILLSDDEFFQEQYIPVTLGDWFTNTEAHNQDLNDVYDGTPQSIGDDIPTGTPNDEQKNALCYALWSFVRLYASAKVCIIQSRNFLQVAWDEVLQAVNAVYNSLVSSLGFIYTPDLYSCFVDPLVAIEALQNEAAIEELACFLLEELSGVAMSQANFDDAILAAAMTLTDDAQKIACLMQNDNNLTVYLNFLEAYNIALQRQQNGETLDCPCVVGTYRIWSYDFANGYGVFDTNYFGTEKTGIYVSGRLAGIDVGDQKAIILNWNDFDPNWRVRGVKIYYERVDGIGNGTDDVASCRLRPTPNSNSGATTMFSNGFLTNGILTACGSRHAVSPFYATGGRQLNIDLRVTDNATSAIYLDRIEIEFMEGFHYGGYPTDDGDICS